MSLNYTHAIPPGDEPKPARPCPSCSQCGKTFHVTDEEVAAAQALGDPYPGTEPAKTHDLSVQRVGGGHLNRNVIITVGDGTDEHDVYLPAGVAQDLGRVLAALTDAQRQLLVDDLTGGEK